MFRTAPLASIALFGLAACSEPQSAPAPAPAAPGPEASSSAPQAATDEWVVAWRSNGQRCHVGKLPLLKPVRDIFPKDISKSHPTEKAACLAALKLKTDAEDPGEEKCFDYSPETISSCKKAGVIIN